ncbi:hypothetical protein [Sphingobium yanoikuyae]|uniref:hypothetical protein n=1 Tax=Sphingobium yanoikuyae TaxID=13690 RepID=UPI0008468019|nr:hypothetical protein [Sphingobium yanoikuyae]
MIITEISYRSLKTGRGYNNSAVEARAQLEDGEDPDKALADLRFWVEKQVDDNLKELSAMDSLRSATDRLEGARAEAERIEKRVDAYRTILKEKPRLAELARANGLGGDALLLDHM